MIVHISTTVHHAAWQDNDIVSWQFSGVLEPTQLAQQLPDAGQTTCVEPGHMSTQLGGAQAALNTTTGPAYSPTQTPAAALSGDAAAMEAAAGEPMEAVDAVLAAGPHGDAAEVEITAGESGPNAAQSPVNAQSTDAAAMVVTASGPAAREVGEGGGGGGKGCGQGWDKVLAFHEFYIFKKFCPEGVCLGPGPSRHISSAFQEGGKSCVDACLHF